MIRYSLIVATALAAAAGPSAAQVVAADPAVAAVEKVVADSAARYRELFDKQDAAGIAALFTPEAEYVDATGTVFHGRAAIQAEMAESFRLGPPGKVTIEVVSIRPIAEGLIVEEGGSTFTPDDGGAISQTRYVALHHRQSDGAWLMAGVRELAPAELTPHERLKDLAWLLGDWREEVAGGVTKTSWSWSDDGVALIANFSTRDSEGAGFSGTHRVGWDAERKQFRSWIFDSTGGFADGWWSREADGTWSVRLVGADADGARIATTLVYAADGAENLSITQRDRTRGGEALPPVTVRVVRKPPLPGSAAPKKE